MTPPQRRLLLLLSTVVGLTRLLAVGRSLNDWDEALFSMGVDEYNVNLHHPHPPGYPLFVLAAKLFHLAGANEFRALQMVVILGALFLFPAVVALVREIGFDFPTSICAALIFSFLPNVWIYGGSAFSDVPAATLGIGACALLLRGRRDSRAYILGAIALGVAAGFRVPNLIIGAVPALIATVHRLRARDVRAVIAGVVLGGAITGGSYLGAALASGTIEDYRTRIRHQAEYVRTVDSWRNPHRPPLGDAAKVFLLWPVNQRQQMGGLALLAIIGLVAAIVTRRWALLLPLLIFGPSMIMAWLNLDIATAARYAIAYMVVHAMFAAYALRVIGRSTFTQCILAVVVITVFIVWTWPALRLQRTSDPPATAALLWVKENVPRDAPVYAQGGLGPHATYLLPQHQLAFFETAEEISHLRAGTYVVDTRTIEGGINFVWPRTNPLWKIIRRRNFEAAVVRLESLVQFGEGWHLQEGEGTNTFRWMGKEAHCTLPPMRGGGRLTVRMFVPIDTIQPPPEIEIWFNGALVERFVGTEAFVQKSWRVPSRADRPNELRIVTSDVVVPGNGDTRELGLRFDALSWTPL